MNMVKIALEQTGLTGDRRKLYKRFLTILWAMAEETITEESPSAFPLVPGAKTRGQLLRHLAELYDRLDATSMKSCHFETADGYIPAEVLFPHLRGELVADEIEAANAAEIEWHEFRAAAKLSK